ncbi:MAG TPA: peptidoglycan editing factor PgeF [Casimicrobiaceae bacterium]|nr:peptidoglycan editing factor PgeF [Casimicrobiaceae bacterium]
MDARVASSLEQRIAGAGYDWIVPQWPTPPLVQAFVTTRNGGDSPRRVEAFMPSQPAWLTQVHGANVASISGPTSHPQRADAAVTRDPNVVLAVRIADCMPVLFAARNGSVVAVAHAGWRGMAAGVLERTLDAMATKPADVVTWLGPAIGATAFEIGVDVYDAFTRGDDEARQAFAAKSPGKWLADLEALARMRLARVGVRSIHGGGMCTFTDPARFLSYRRDRQSGRMAAFIWRAPAS